MGWEIKYHDDALQGDILALPSGLLARYLHLTDRMMMYGPDLGMPHTRAISSGLFEIRLKSQEGIGRVFYCTLVRRRIVMLTSSSRRRTRHHRGNWPSRASA